jgi:hypothetical protein
MAPTSNAPLPRFLDIATELHANKTWTDDWELLRWAAIPLTQAEGDPKQVAHRLRDTIRELKRRVKWWGDIVSTSRTFVAGALVADGTPAGEFITELERTRDLFRESKLPRAHVSEVMAALVLREAGAGGRVSNAQVHRMAQLYRRVKQDHRFLLGTSEYATLALLATTTDSPDAIGLRLESIYADLRQRKFGSGTSLIAIPHLLYFHPDADGPVCARFEAIWNAFKEEGLRMQSGDYDEVALLTLTPGTPGAVVKRVLAHRASIDELRPRPGRNPSFSLACATAFLELTAGSPLALRLSRVQAAYQVRYVVASRQAAATAAAS